MKFWKLKFEDWELVEIENTQVTAHSGLNWSGKCPNCNLTMVSTQRHTGNHTDGSWYRDVRATMEDAANTNIPVANVEFMYMAGARRLCECSNSGGPVVLEQWSLSSSVTKRRSAVLPRLCECCGVLDGIWG